MTRINVVPVTELENKHLLAEYRELPRVLKLCRKLDNKERVKDYVLGPGHVKFFYDKILFLKKRQDSIIDELLSRGFNLNFTNTEDFTKVPKDFYNDWEPTENSIQLNRQRIKERLNK